MIPHLKFQGVSSSKSTYPLIADKKNLQLPNISQDHSSQQEGIIPLQFQLNLQMISTRRTTLTLHIY